MLTEATRLRDFPTLAGLAYLNTAAESIPPRCTGDAIHAYWEDKLRGMRGRDGHFAQVEACREVSARMLGLKSSEVSFCSCSSEAYNLLASALQLIAHDEVVVTDLDFPAGVTPWLRAAAPPFVRLWQAANGALHPQDLEPLLNANTRLVQVSLVSFYNGRRVDWPAFHDAVRRLAPNAIISVDITQALGRVVLDCAGADILISSTHKWTLGIHGGCIIGIPEAGSARLTTRAGGWLHIENAFAADRFTSAIPKTGAASFAVGMPNFVALYALNASLRYLEEVGIANIAAHADPLVREAEAGLCALGINPMCAWNGTGILAFQHPRSTELHAALERENIHVMHNAGRIRLAVHGYNAREDIRRFLQVLGTLL
ncbi:MAG TPA: aminotransferase class V-fold PLP-dependent enzyme [Chthoniobacteraceae bacterium]|jgi:selenocysteine lyase/cysteine desulfurase|nr:aminotransferase class V-fold PLP-dependent enzyme [Chthoniobacteraceae bacterium]